MLVVVATCAVGGGNYGGDFYDIDSNVVTTMIMDVLCAGLGEGLGAVYGSLFKNSTNIAGRKLSILSNY